MDPDLNGTFRFYGDHARVNMFAIGSCNEPERRRDYIRSCVAAYYQYGLNPIRRNSDMEFFRRLLKTIGTSLSPDKNVDFISNMPVEIAHHLLRMLDAQSLLNAAYVSRNWLNVCKRCSCLKKSARHHIRMQRYQLEQNPKSNGKSKKISASGAINVPRVDISTRRTYDASLSLHKFHAISFGMIKSRINSPQRPLNIPRKVETIKKIITMR